MNVSRVEAFSDGVFAVAITLLVLQFAVPDVQSGKLLAALLAQWPLLVTYVASFLTVGVIWVNHHTIFSGIKQADRTLQFINLILLLFVVLVPYPTQLLARYLQSGSNSSVAAAFYGVVMTGMGIAFQALVAWAITHPKLLKPNVDAARIRSQSRATLSAYSCTRVPSHSPSRTRGWWSRSMRSRPSTTHSTNCPGLTTNS